MKIELPINSELGLQIASGLDRVSPYPTARIQKGLVLLFNGEDLSEEAVGFGVPIIKRGLQSTFPSEVDLFLHGGCDLLKVSARYKLNLEEKIARNGSGPIKNQFLYVTKNSLAAIIRKVPALRKLLTSTSNLLRSRLAWETTYEASEFQSHLVLTYLIDEVNSKIEVQLVSGDFLSSTITEIVIMNELGAHHFDQYQESNGNRQIGSEIGCWDMVEAEKAAFVDRKHKLSFQLAQVQGAKLYRGRELIEPRLAWSGFGYSFPPELKNFSYQIELTKLV